MNRFAARGLAIEAASGKEVLILSHNQTVARHAMLDVDTDEPEALRVMRVNGREQISYPSGGRIRFISYRSNLHLRGLIADIVFVDWPIDAEPDGGGSDQFWDTLRAIVATSAHGEIVRA